MTRDSDYMLNPVYAGCNVSREIAKFLADQIVYNPDTDRYDINGAHISLLLIRVIRDMQNKGKRPKRPMNQNGPDQNGP